MHREDCKDKHTVHVACIQTVAKCPDGGWGLGGGFGGVGGGGGRGRCTHSKIHVHTTIGMRQEKKSCFVIRA